MTDRPKERPAPLTLQGLPTRRLTRPERRCSRELAGEELLERYAVDRVLGEGGMATVYAGRHITIGRPVAIKVLHDELAEQSEPVSWFLLEARAASRIRQENVVEITDFGVTPEGLVFLVMEQLDGENLARTIAREGPLPWSRLSAIMLQICDALAAAHAAGVVHRDLKPANCFRITRSGSDDFIKVLDFGIAMVMARGTGDPAPQQSGISGIAGTPEYMAPEQARGHQCDHRVDVYAAGAILYELATGCPPYAAPSSAELMAFHLHAPVPDPCAMASGLPLAATEIVERAMAKDAADRFDSMHELAAAIRAAGRAHDDAPRRRPISAWMVATTVAATAVTAWVARPEAESRGLAAIAHDELEPPAAVAAPDPARAPVLAPAAPPPVVVIERTPLDASAPREPERGSANLPIVSAVPPPPDPRPERPKTPRAAMPSRAVEARPAATGTDDDELDPTRPRTSFSPPVVVNGSAERSPKPAKGGATEVKNPFSDQSP